MLQEEEGLKMCVTASVGDWMTWLSLLLLLLLHSILVNVCVAYIIQSKKGFYSKFIT